MKYQRKISLITSLGKSSITSAQAEKLDSVGFTYTGLLRLCSSCKDEDDFTKALKTKGVNSKVLPKKLWNVLSSKT